MPGDAASLTTLATVKTELGLTSTDKDDYLQYLIKVSSEHLSRKCNREFHYSAAWTEAVPAYGSSRLIVTHTPVISVASVTYYDGVVDSAGYILSDSVKGWIFNRSGWRSSISRLVNVAADDTYAGSESNDYTVVYAGGYVTPQQVIDTPALTRTLPYDLEHACVQHVASLFLNRGQDRRIASDGLMSYNVTYRDADELPVFAAVVRRYRRVGTGR